MLPSRRCCPRRRGRTGGNDPWGSFICAPGRLCWRRRNPRWPGRWPDDLVSTLSGRTQEQFLVDRDREAPEELVLQVLDGVDRLKRGEPLPYVLGEWTFYGLPMAVSPDVLIPRDDTCALAELAIHRGLFLEKDPRILDLCCGSGCIGLAIAGRLKDARVTLADLSREALTVAKKNIQRNHLGGRVSCIPVDARKEPAAFLGKFDIDRLQSPLYYRKGNGGAAQKCLGL